MPYGLFKLKTIHCHGMTQVAGPADSKAEPFGGKQGETTRIPRPLVVEVRGSLL